jgi:hypothetical protein
MSSEIVFMKEEVKKIAETWHMIRIKQEYLWSMVEEALGNVCSHIFAYLGIRVPWRATCRNCRFNGQHNSIYLYK